MFINLSGILSSLLVFQCFGIFVLSEIPRPRGVSISRASLYTPSETFTCIDGKKTVLYRQVNDDFCDCEDGSDEPGTSACSNGVFHCANAGHRSLNIPSSRVNDGVCDCCDTSDEYASEAQCVLNCSELGREEKVRQKIFADLTKRGNQLRSEMGAKGRALKDEQKQRLLELQKSIEQAEGLRAEREEIKRSAESAESAALEIYREAEEVEKKRREEQETKENRREAETAFIKFDSNNDGMVEVADLQTRVQFDSNRDGEVTVEEARYFLDEHEQVDLETFVSLCWPRIKPFMMLESGLFKGPEAKEDVHDEYLEKKPDDEDVIAAQTNEQAELNVEGEEIEDEEHYDEEETGEGEASRTAFS